MKLHFSARGKETLQDIEPIPRGVYLAKITKEEVKVNSAGTGKILKLEWTVLHGNYRGRKVFDNINIVHPNEMAQEIAEKTLASICHAIGQLEIKDTKQLLEIPCEIRVKVEQPTKVVNGKKVADAAREPQNRITNYKPAPKKRRPGEDEDDVLSPSTQAGEVEEAAPENKPTKPPAKKAKKPKKLPYSPQDDTSTENEDVPPWVSQG